MAAPALPRHVVVIGAGFAGLAAAAVLAKAGVQVDLLEKLPEPGGRARSFVQGGFTFDRGPSWYWMPDVMEAFFQRFGTTTADHFDLRRLDPSYQVVLGRDRSVALPADPTALRRTLETLEPGCTPKLDAFLAQAERKYRVGMGRFVHKPALSWREFARPELLREAFALDLFRSHAAHLRRFFHHPELLRILEFPVLFLGAMPDRIPALYSMLNHADMQLGTWYPMGGFGKLVDAFVRVAEQAGARIHLGVEVQRFAMAGDRVQAVHTSSGTWQPDAVVSGADLHHTEQVLLPPAYRTYSEAYWASRTLAPACLLYHIGVGRKLPRLQHHNLFLEDGYAAHAKAIYDVPAWPDDPLFYACCPSITDPSVAPEGMENLFVLVPVAPGLEDDAAVRARYFNLTMERLEQHCGVPIRPYVVVYNDYAGSDFRADYNAFRGNAYGLANTLMQTAVLKPRIHQKRVGNLWYTGQLTVPGPGVPPAIISGQLVADHLLRTFTHAKA